MLYLGFRWLAARNVPPTAAGNAALEWATWFTAWGAVPLSFLAFALPGAGRWWLLARLAIAGFLGLNACAIVACNWIKYPEAGRDSGLLGLWMLAVMFGALTFLICTGITLFLLKGSPRG